MPYEPHWRARLNGVIGFAEPFPEIFSYGFAFGGEVTNPGNLAGLLAACAGFHSNPLAQISNQARLTEIALSRVGVDGRQIGETQRYPRDVPGGGGVTRLHPPQVAMRVSLDSGLRGRSQKGGFYIPLPNLEVQPGQFQVLDVEAARVALAAKDMIDTINGLDGITNVIIASGVVGNIAVRRVRVGTALDTIRTRRNQLVERYQQELVAQ